MNAKSRFRRNRAGRFILVLLILMLATGRGSSGGAIQTRSAGNAWYLGAATAAAADALAAKFDGHQFVLIGSTHGDAKIDEFLMCLVSRPGFKQRVSDIVVEWASSAHQRLLDRYMLMLEPVPMDELARIWLDTDAPTMWTTLPSVRQFVEALRDVNKTLPAGKRIRLVGGNDPTDWTKVHRVEDVAPYPFKTNFMPHLILEHLARSPGNRTLVVYGDGHIRHNSANFMADVEYVLGRARFFVVGTIHELRQDERAYLALLGDPANPFFAEAKHFPAGAPWPGSLRTRLEERPTRPADYIDALLYLGPEPNRVQIGSIPLTAAQETEVARRHSILSDPQRSMRARFEGRDKWFREHPNDFPPRP
jgi:hypothetical protein